MRRPNYSIWLEMFKNTLSHGTLSKPRGECIRELFDYQIKIDSMYPFMNFTHRGLRINYFKTEMLWKLGADPFDDSIKNSAKMWSEVQNRDKSFNSNYGQYWFGEQRGLFSVFNELVKDIYSRRAVIPMLKSSHIGPQVKDTVCTECVGFRIRDGKLDMSVHMRSSDQVFGLGTDIPTFAFLHRLLLGMLLPVYSDICLGEITITAMSSHIYARHFDRVNNIIADPIVSHCSVMPIPTTYESFKLAACAGNVDRDWGPLSFWLLNSEEA